MRSSVTLLGIWLAYILRKICFPNTGPLEVSSRWTGLWLTGDLEATSNISGLIPSPERMDSPSRKEVQLVGGSVFEKKTEVLYNGGRVQSPDTTGR